MIDQSAWIWQGTAAHFIGSHNCRFHLTTIIGDYLVSTIGDYYSHGERHRVGCDRFYETMVFPHAICDCDCGQYIPVIDDGPLYFQGYNSISEAHDGHMEACFLAATEKLAKTEPPTN